jgi:hypothetical protein
MAKGQVIFLKLGFCVLQFTHREHTQQIVLFLLSPERYESGFSPLFYAKRTERAKERTRETVFCSSFLFFFIYGCRNYKDEIAHSFCHRTKEEKKNAKEKNLRKQEKKKKLCVGTNGELLLL